MRIAATLFWTVLLVAGCATELPLPSPVPNDGAAATDLTGAAAADLTATVPFFTGTFTWDSSTASSSTVCDNGGSSRDAAPSGDFRIGPGPGPNQVNIGVGSNTCPIFIFDVKGNVAVLANVGATCPSGPGAVTTRTGSLTTIDGGHTVVLAVVLDLSVPGGMGGMGGMGSMHCVLTVAGTTRRKQ